MEGERARAIAQLHARGLSKAHAEVLTDQMRPRRVAPGEDLLVAGTLHDALYLVVEGKLAVYIDQDGEELLLGKVRSGHWIGEISLVDHGPATTTVRGAQECVLLVLDADGLKALEAEHPKIASKLLTLICKDLAMRLRRSSAGLIANNGEVWKLASPPQRKSWISEALGWLGVAS